MSAPSRTVCPYCPGSERLFLVSRGLNVHISHMHKDVLPQPPNVILVPAPTPTAPSGPTLEMLPDCKGSVPVLKHIPKGARTLVAGKLKSIIDDCLSTNSVESWLRLLSFSYSVLRVPDRSDPRSLTAKVKSNIDHDVDLASSECVYGGVQSRASSVKRIEKKVHDGDLRGAVRLLVSDATLAPNNVETLDALRGKHPSPSRQLVFPTSPDDDSDLYLSVTEPDVLSAINSFYSGSAGGLDGLRPEHLKELTSPSAGDNAGYLLTAITNLCNFLLKGMLNPQVCPYLYGANLCALIKKDGGVRPIAVGSIWRRLVAKLGCQAVRSEMSAYLRPHQLGFGTPLGCEAAIHATRTYALTQDTDFVLLKLDLKNAFNSVERDVILSEVKERVPLLYKFLNQCYSAPSNLFYGGSLIASEVGAQQGDPLGPLLFSLAIHGIVSSLKSPLNLWYLDDGILGGSADSVIEDVGILFPKLREVGLEVNTEKCEIFMSSERLAHDVFTDFCTLIPGVKVVDKSSLTLLGSPIFAEGVPAVLQAKKRSLGSIHGSLKLLSSHVALTLLRSCFSMPKLTYTIRTAPTWNFRRDVDQLDDLLRSTLETILNVSMNESQWHQASLPIRFGGLGMRRVKGTGLAAFLASAYGVRDLVTQILSLNGDEVSIPFVDEALAAWAELCPGQELPESRGMQRAWDNALSEVTLNSLLGEASGRDLARLKAVSSPESGIWLHALPSPQLGTLLDNDSLRICVALRLGCDACEPHVCSCGAQVDPSGVHGLSCTFSAGRIQRHHSLNNIVRRALTSANVPCVLEPPGLSRTDGKRPDGLTLVPWERGRSLLWDATCSCTYAASHLPATTLRAGAAAEAAAKAKHTKYADLKSTYLFVPVAVETAGVWSSEAKKFLFQVGRLLREKGLGPRAGEYLAQRISLAIQRGNVASVMGTFGRAVFQGGLFE